MNKARMLIASGLAVGMSAVAQAQATVETVTAEVSGITATATTGYVSAAGLGVAVLIVGTLVYMSKRGWKLR